MKESNAPLPHEPWEELPQSGKELFREQPETANDSVDLDLAELKALLEDSPPAKESPRKTTPSGKHFAEKKAKSPKSRTEQTPSESPKGKGIAIPPFLKTCLEKWNAKSRKFRLLAVLCAAAVLFLLVGGGFLIRAATDPYDNRILDNTTIGGIPVGGMTQWEAYQALKEATKDTFSQQAMEVVLPDGTISLTPDQTKVKLSAWSAAKSAYHLGRKGTPEEKQAALTASTEAGTALDLLPHLKLNQGYIRTQLEDYAAQHNIAYSEVSYTLTGTQPALAEAEYNEAAPGQTLELTLGTPLVELDVDGVLAQILAAYNVNLFQVTIDIIPPTSVPAAPDLDAIYREFLVEPVNTGLDFTTYAMVPGSYGYAPDLEAAKTLLQDASYGQTISIPMVYITPEILGEGAYFRDELGYCETPHTNNENRNVNLVLACEALNGYIMQPGEEFSYNDVLGERTAEKGYKPAPAYSGTDTVNSIGGGVCQGSSTLYYAALVADLEIIERVNHGFRSSYIPIGLDATVSWNGPDFKFANNTHFPIMIKAEVSDGYMKMWIFGTEERSYYVKLDSKITGIDEYQVVSRYYPPESGYVDGQRISGGTNGYYAQSFSCKYDRLTDELISEDFIAYSSYMRIDAVVASVPAPTPPEETP